MSPRSAVGVLLGLAGIAAAQVAPPPLIAYREAEQERRTATVEGVAVEERRRPSEPDRPLTGAAIVLVPRSDALLRGLEDVRRHSRVSGVAYRTAVTEIRLAREAYEQALWEAGAADLVRQTTVGPDGAFRFEPVPAGAWLLFGSHARRHETKGPRASRKERQTFEVGAWSHGYETVDIWVREVTVALGAPAALRLTDRTVWFSGIVEDRRCEASRVAGCR